MFPSSLAIDSPTRWPILQRSNKGEILGNIKLAPSLAVCLDPPHDVAIAECVDLPHDVAPPLVECLDLPLHSLTEHQKQSINKETITYLIVFFRQLNIKNNQKCDLELCIIPFLSILCCKQLRHIHLQLRHIHLHGAY